MNIYKERILELRKLIDHYNDEYYNNDKSVISDKEFDNLLSELIKLEKKYPEFDDLNSPSKRVGGGVTKKFNVAKHTYPMYSLDNTYTKNEVIDWDNRVKKNLGINEIEYTCELKYDGASINLIYEDGILVRGITRGNGIEGDDVTLNVKTIKDIPLKLSGKFPKKIEVRGEIILPLNEFKNLNRIRQLNGEKPFMNPRNTASGSLKLQDSNEVAKRPLKAFIYAVISDESIDVSHYNSLVNARANGFLIPDSIVRANSLDEVFGFINLWRDKKSNLNYEIDGVVIKVNNINYQKTLGHTSKFPRWAIAFKYDSERTTTEIKSLRYQVGRTGSVTPVANLSPVLLSGTIIKSASLHNEDQILKLGLRIGDKVFIEKGGEIIPKIVGVDDKYRGQESEKIRFIDNCPECNSKLIRNKNQSNHYCENENECRPQIIGKIQHFISKEAMDIEGIGNETVVQLYDNHLIKNIVDLYKLKFTDLIKLDRMAEKSINNLLDGIEKSKNNPYEKVLFGLGIRFVGKTVAKKIIEKFPNIDNLINASFDDLNETNNIGDKIAKSLIKFFSNQINIDLINELKYLGLNFKKLDKTLFSNTLSNKSFVISGTFEFHTREEIKSIIELNGGKISSSISSKTSYVLAGKSMGPKKKIKANKLGVNVIDEKEFLKMLEL